MPRPPSITVSLLVAVVISGCGDEAKSSAELRVVATTTQLADLARNVAGDRAAVRGLLSPNADPHEYEVRPSDVEALADTPLVLRSGGDLDEWLGEAVRSAGGSPQVLTLSEGISGAREDPHWWQDPRNAMRATERIRDALVTLDGDDAAAYRSAADAYLADLRALDTAVAACIDQIPARSRKLVTTHDALGFYADRYGLEVIGAVIPSRSTRGQPSAGETAGLVATIKQEKVEAIFAESSVDPRVEEAIARESGATVGEALYADTLGPKGSAGDTYVKSIQANTRAIVAGLTRGEQECRFPAE